MCDNLDTCAEMELNRLVPVFLRTLCAITPINSTTGKLQPPGREAASTWCKESWTAITLDMVKTCFKICGLTLALDGSEDHA